MKTRSRRFFVVFSVILFLIVTIATSAVYFVMNRGLHSDSVVRLLSGIVTGYDPGIDLSISGQKVSPTPDPSPTFVTTVSYTSPTIPSNGKLILVNRANNVQELYAYQNGKVVFNTPVTTGELYLQTFLGTWHVYRKLTNLMLYSPWPKGSPYYYPPDHANYALDYDGALFIHDATWRSVFGPGTDRWHYDPKFGWMDGSHGCVNVPLTAMQWLYNWADIGTTVEIID